LTTFITSDNISFIEEVFENRHNWMDDPKKRDLCMSMLNEFDHMTHDQYWLTDDEELFINQAIHTIESCC
jgi:hypothetical protein